MHPYKGRKAALSTMHDKRQAIGKPFNDLLGVSIKVPEKINTDLLGTFSGEIERELTPLETLRKKARMGMDELGLPLGLASEGSFAPHRYFPMVAEDHEILLWIDDERGIEVIEQEISLETNYDAKTVTSFNDLKDFLDKVHFPSHALVVRPNSGFIQGFTFKGLKRSSEVKEAINLCTSASADGLVHVETDMRAHMNPTRMKVINKLAEKLAVRLMNLCPNCSCPGWGVVDVVRGLPCEACGLLTKQIAKEVYGCPSCNFRKEEPRQDGVTTSSPTYCDWCNP
ncbi:DUF6671 family protein [Halalkalibacter alkaliphilus]|uniref:DUF6671 domain-containing protein n=1 Tax=Halalkalibacter alkaliphilus TaxID=2917993 RepID=A0A9X2CME1_9BACI|nr:DUF6671 family protein [Halalkalibacter alkaliphilus]MCL7745513.1 hypothetical protein [Halalkalibacter alkaliphilus]